MSNKKKKKREKIRYIDDGRTIADMSAFSKSGKSKDGFVRPPSTFKDKWKTYWSAVKSMLVPMFITLGALAVVFFTAYVLLDGFSK